MGINKEWYKGFFIGCIVATTVWLFVTFLTGCAVPSNILVEHAYECGKNDGELSYSHRKFDGGVWHLTCKPKPN